MKVYLSVDIEGVACVTTTKQEPGDYQRARKWMTAEANAAVEAAYESGATTVVVADSHGSMRNLLPDELHEDALLVQGSPRPLTMMEGLDESFDAVFIGMGLQKSVSVSDEDRNIKGLWNAMEFLSAAKERKSLDNKNLKSMSACGYRWL